MKICYDLERGWRCGADGVRLNGNPPVLRYKEKPVWTLLFLKNGSPCGTADFSGAVSFRAAVDVDLNTETEVICRTTDESIGRENLSHGELTVPVNANTSGFRAAANGQESRKALFELWGFDTNADPVFYIRFEIRISGVVDPEGGVSPESVTPDTITRAEVMACLRAPDERQYTSDPADSSAAHTSQTGSDTYTRRRNSAAAGEWGPWEALVSGPQGVQGPQGPAPVLSGGSVTTLPAGSSASASLVSSGSNTYVLNLGIPQGSTGIMAFPIRPYSSDSAYSALSCIAYNGGGYQVISDTAAGENPDNAVSKFVCFASRGINGADGETGMDGISPLVSVTQTSSGVSIYTSDAECITSGEILNGSFTMPIQPYSPDSAYSALSCIAYNGGGYQVLSATEPGENPDNAASKFVCFASPGGIPDFQVISSGGSSIVPQVNRVYTFALTSGAVISVDSSGLTSSVCVTQELWLDMPSPAVSFTLPAFTWVDGSAPDFDRASTRFAVTVRWDGSEFLANLAYTKDLA